MDWKFLVTNRAAIVVTIWTELLTGICGVQLWAWEVAYDDIYYAAPSPHESVSATYQVPTAGPYGMVVNDDRNAQLNAIPETSNIGTLSSATPELVELKKQLVELQQTTDQLKVDLEKQSKKEVKATDPYKFKFGGHVSLDAVNISQNEESREMLGNTYNSFDIRDVRVQMQATGHGNMECKAVVGFNNSVKIYDAYLRFKDTQYFGDITIGNFFVESGMESTTVTFDRVFVSLDEGANMFRMNRHLGVSSTLFSENKQTRAMFGAFLAPSISSPSHFSCDNDPGLILNTRLTTAPILSVDDDGYTREVFHLGASYFWLAPGGETSLRLRTRGLMWNGSNPYFLDSNIPMGDNSYGVSQAEVAYQLGGFAITGDGFVGSFYDGGESTYGCTIATRCFLTPHCSRSYKKDTARFGSICMPEEAVFLNYKDRSVGQNWGALEAIAKWEWVDANNLKNFDKSTYGIVNRVVTGANWFLNDQTFLALNWEHAFISATKNEKHADLEYDTIVSQVTFKF